MLSSSNRESHKLIKSRSQIWLRRAVHSRELEVKPMFHRRNSVTEFNLGSPLPAYDRDDETDSESMMDITLVLPRRNSVVLIEKPTSNRVLDMELPSPPKKPFRCVTIDSFHNRETNLAGPEMFPQKSKSQRNILFSGETNTMPKPPSSSFRNLLRQPSFRRNAVTKSIPRKTS